MLVTISTLVSVCPAYAKDCGMMKTLNLSLAVFLFLSAPDLGDPLNACNLEFEKLTTAWEELTKAGEQVRVIPTSSQSLETALRNWEPSKMLGASSNEPGEPIELVLKRVNAIFLSSGLTETASRLVIQDIRALVKWRRQQTPKPLMNLIVGIYPAQPELSPKDFIDWHHDPAEHESIRLHRTYLGDGLMFLEDEHLSRDEWLTAIGAEDTERLDRLLKGKPVTIVGPRDISLFKTSKQETLLHSTPPTNSARVVLILD